MTTTRHTRLKRIAAALPPPPAPGPGELTAEQLDAMSTAELWDRFEARCARWEASPEGRAHAAALEAMSDEELLAVWERKPWRRA